MNFCLQICYKLCRVCSKYILKKQFRLHTKLHEGMDTVGRIEDLDTSREDEEEEEEEEGEEAGDTKQTEVP